MIYGGAGQGPALGELSHSYFSVPEKTVIFDDICVNIIPTNSALKMIRCIDFMNLGTHQLFWNIEIDVGSTNVI